MLKYPAVGRLTRTFNYTRFDQNIDRSQDWGDKLIKDKPAHAKKRGRVFFLGDK